MRDYLDQLVKEEWPEGRSAGAAARELCRSLGVSNAHPNLKRLLETLLAESNAQAFDRSRILAAVDEAAPTLARKIRQESFARVNGRAA